jgi:hypothetical protein
VAAGVVWWRRVCEAEGAIGLMSASGRVTGVKPLSIVYVNKRDRLRGRAKGLLIKSVGNDPNQFSAAKVSSSHVHLNVGYLTVPPSDRNPM